VLLEEALSRIRKIYGIEVFKENSILHSAPNFREKRHTNLTVDYTYAYVGLGGSRLPIWKGFNRKDNKPVKILPYTLVFYFNEGGLSILFCSLRYKLRLTDESYEKYFDFLEENMDYIQTIQTVSGMCPLITCFRKNDNIIISFKELLKKYKQKRFYNLDFIKTVQFPLDYDSIDFLVDSFVVFFPVYYSLLKIAQGEKHNFGKLISKIKPEHILKKNNAKIQQEKVSDEHKKINTPIIDTLKFLKAGIRWQVFERDDFKCVSCGASAADGAILHIDHIIPRSKGGKDDMDNYQTLCHLCNIGKSNKSDKNLRRKK
jgi:hypothetical protein